MRLQPESQRIVPETLTMERRGWKRTNNSGEISKRNLYSVCVPGTEGPLTCPRSRLTSQSLSGSRKSSASVAEGVVSTPFDRGPSMRDTSIGTMDIWIAAQQLLEKEEDRNGQSEIGPGDTGTKRN